MGKDLPQKSSKIVSREQAVTLVEQLRAAGKRIGFTSGVFDLLHAGHVAYLQAARGRCDYLVVGLNSDLSVRQLKGENRPIIPGVEREKVLAALAAVDLVFQFDESNNNRNVELLKPSLYIKAGDYSKQKLSSAAIVEAAGGAVEVVGFEAGLSSSNIIERIVERYGKQQAYSEPIAPYEPRPAAFLDRDGTINEHVEYLHEVEKFKLIPGALEGMKRLQEAGFRIVIVTNQPGIGLGLFTKEDFFRVNRELLKQASAAGVSIDRIYFSPYSKSDNSACRKPGTALVERAIADLNIIRERSFFVGDMSGDVQTGINAGMRTVLVKTGRAGQDKIYSCNPNFEAADLGAAAEIIIREAANAVILPIQASERRAIALEDMGHSFARIGHELNNLLGPIVGCVDLLESKIKRIFPENNPVERQIGIMQRALTKAEALATQLRGYVRPGEMKRETLSLKDVAAEIIKEFSAETEGRVTFELVELANPMVQSSAVVLGSVVRSLLKNSAEAMRDRKEPMIVAIVDTFDYKPTDGSVLRAGRYARLSVIDHGRGLSQAMQKSILQAFEAHRPLTGGTGLGLGLVMAREFARRVGGDVQLSSQEGTGTCVRLLLPLVSV